MNSFYINDPANQHAAAAARALPTKEFQLVEQFIGSLAASATETQQARQVKAWEIAAILAQAGFTSYSLHECNALTNVEALAEQYGLSVAGTAQAYAQIWMTLVDHTGLLRDGEDFISKRAYVLFQTVRDVR